MDQNLWGKYGWYTHHILTTLLHPSLHTSDQYELVRLTEYILPCSICRASYKRNLAAVQPMYLNPNATEMRKAGLGLNRALFDVHNIVNQKTHKPMYKWETFTKDMELQQHVFSIHFASNAMLYCSFIAHAHDNIKGEIDTDHAMAFLQCLCQCLRASKSHPRVGTLCEDMGLHGSSVLARARAHLAAQGRIYLTAVVQDMFSIFLHMPAHRPVPPSLSHPLGIVTTTARALQPYYDVHNNEDVSYAHTAATAASSKHLYSNLTRAIEVAQIRK